MGIWILHQPHAAGRVGEVFAGSGATAESGSQITRAQHAALSNLQIYQLPYWFSFHSSYQAIWMASSLPSFDFLGSSANTGNSMTYLCRSVNRTVSGSRSGYFSCNASPRSSAFSHFNSVAIAILRSLHYQLQITKLLITRNYLPG